jgi:hypothetical protein
MKRLLYILLTASLLGVVGGCGSSEQIDADDLVNNPNTANGSVDKDKLPIFEFEKEEHDFGRLREGEQVSYTFKFKNVGKRDLVISGQKTTCGCTVADYSKTPIKPGESGQVTVSFNSEGKGGMNMKTVTLTANTQPNTKVLTIRAEVLKAGS